MTMRYLTNESGKKTDVLIAIKDWELIKKELETIQFKERMRNALTEIKLFKEGKIKLKPLKEALDEL